VCFDAGPRVWNLSRGRSIVGSSGVDIGDGSDPDSL
jgi:hypothetical protein